VRGPRVELKVYDWGIVIQGVGLFRWLLPYEERAWSELAPVEPTRSGVVLTSAERIQQSVIFYGSKTEVLATLGTYPVKIASR
jgi:hypothetical protein